MKIRHKKILLSGVAVTVAGILGVGALLETSISVQASSAMMPGIEEIVNETSKDEPFRILEIVDSEDEAEIGYYVSGQEPYIRLYRDENGNLMNFSSLEDGLSKLPEKERREFATNKKTDENGNVSYTGKNVESLCGDSESDYPLAYSEYQEQYFVSSEEGWNKVDFVDADGNSRTDIVKIEGHYQENSSGNGDYTKQEQTYYPIRKDVAEDNAKTNKYRENIENFYYSDDEKAQAPYVLTFAEVKNEDVNKALEDANDKGQVTILPEYDYSNGKYGYYENVYADLTEDIANNIQDKLFKFPGENPTVDESKALLIQNNTPQGASAFSAGEEEEFSTANDGNTTIDAAQQSDFGNDVSESSSADEFSTGDFGDGDSTSDVQTQANTPQVTDSNAGQTDNANTEDQSSKGRTILIGFKNEKTKGTAENPYIYLGENIEAYPYYKYTLVGDLENVRTIAQANQQKDAQSVADNTEIVRNEKDITLEDGQYWYWKTDSASNQLAKYPLSIVTGRQAVPYSDIKKIDNSLDYNYYYTVEKAYFCCKSSTDNPQLPTDYQYYGWYYSSYPQNDENTYLKIIDGDGKVATHYISDAEYKLTTGTGDYDFVPNEGETEQIVEVDHIYYQGGYVNHDWFKRYVFHLSPDDKEQFKNFNIVVNTMTATEFNEKYENGTTTVTTESMDVAATVDDSGVADNNNGVDFGINSEVNSDEIEPDNAADAEEQPEADSETSEVDSMVSEAGVELVSIENEINDNATSDFQDGTDTISDADNTETQQTDASNVDAASADTSDITFSDGESGDATTFSAGEADSVNTSINQLSEYDLIYINGAVTSKATEVIGEIPVIINSVKISSTNDLLNTFSSFVRQEDADGHYVNTYVYFFKDTFSKDNPAGMINLDFHKNFNSESDGSTFTDGDAKKGFEEILEYIESENQYRQIGQTTDGTQALSDGDETSDNESIFSADDSDSQLLSKELTQARAIEYIINYKFRRKLNTKSSYNILEIEPAKSNGTLKKEMVYSWLGYTDFDFIDLSKTKTCCAYDESQNIKPNNPEYAPAKYMFDGNPSTIWHSNWGKYPKGHTGTDKYNGKHHIYVTFNKEMTITGFDYLPRTGNSNGSQNGKIKKFELHLYREEEQKDEIDIGDYGKDSFEYDPSKGGIQGDSSLKTFRFADGKEVSGVKSAEIVILDAGTDNGNGLSFASCAELSFSTPVNASLPKVNIDVMTSSEYVGHIEDINSKYDMIYIGADSTNRTGVINGDGNMLYTHVGSLVKASTSNKWKLMGLYPQDFLENKIDININSPTAGFRGSGNDITMQQYRELMSFVKSGYPVVIADGLVQNGKINTSVVDNSSYVYKFLESAQAYRNVMTYTNASKQKQNIFFYVNVAKPKIVFSDGGMPPEAPRDKYKAGDDVTDENGKKINTYNYINGEMRYTFKIENESSVSAVNTQYDCRLYFDLNFDGNFSDDEEQAEYIEIRDSAQVVQLKTTDSQGTYYHLKEGEEYTVIRKIPSQYFKIIAWKLEILNVQNPDVKTSVTGYSKQKNTTGKEKINVLQIVPNKTCAADKPSYVVNGQTVGFGTWDLGYEMKYNKKKEKTFGYKASRLEDFDIEVTAITVEQFEGKKSTTSNEKKTPEEWLDDKQIVIIGFDDVYDNIELTAVEAIRTFIENGRSVIFSHDTTSLYNFSYNEKRINNVAGSGDNQILYPTFIRNNSKQDWGVSMNQVLREIVGMDRYGITSKNQTVSQLLKAGRDISDSVSIKTLMEVAGDVAYKNGSGMKESYKETQGYVNNEIQGVNSGNTGTTKATKVNDGAITQYPYIIGDTMTISNTHSQYYQLAMEQDKDINGHSDNKNDIVVWYCLADNIYSNSPNDVRNNYYFYSKGNVIYTGVGHSTVKQEMEVNLFINAIVAAANVSAVEPDINFVKSLNPAADKEKVRYYMTDMEKWTEASGTDGNVLEKDMDLYFTVRDYNMVNSSLSKTDSEDMTVDIYIESENGSLNLGKGELAKKKLIKLNSDITGLTSYSGNNVITVGEDGTFHVENNTAYGFNIKDMEQYVKKADGSYKQNCKVYVQVTSTVTLYNLPKTNTAYTSIDLKQRQLFNLD